MLSNTFLMPKYSEFYTWNVSSKQALKPALSVYNSIVFKEQISYQNKIKKIQLSAVNRTLQQNAVM